MKTESDLRKEAYKFLSEYRQQIQAIEKDVRDLCKKADKITKKYKNLGFDEKTLMDLFENPRLLWKIFSVAVDQYVKKHEVNNG